MHRGADTASALPIVRAYRLAISSVCKPWAANCVQLACLDLLLGTPAEQAEAAAACTASAPQQVGMPSPACSCPVETLHSLSCTLTVLFEWQCIPHPFYSYPVSVLAGFLHLLFLRLWKGA